MIYFDEYGERKNPTILLLHGAAALDTFCNQYCFSMQYHLVVPHLHGAGKSADKVYDPKLMKQKNTPLEMACPFAGKVLALYKRTG